MKTITFRAYLNSTQTAICEDWLNALKWVWNEGLGLLVEHDNFSAYHKKDRKSYPCSPIGWQYRFEKNSKGEWEPFAPYCELFPKKGPRFCPLPDSDFTPRIGLNIGSDPYKSLTKYFAAKNHADRPWFTAVLSDIVRGTLKSLGDAWVAYKKGIRKKPRFKGKNDKITTLIRVNAKSTRIGKRFVDGGRILGHIKTDNTLSERWLTQEPICVWKLTKKPSGWYIQLTGDIPYNLPPANDKAVGIDVGVKYVFASSDGELIDPPRYRKASEKRLSRLQRSLSRRIGGNNLKPGQQPSKRYQRRQKEIARLHEKIADQRRLFNHALSTKLVSDYGAIAAEDIKLPNLTRRAKPKLREDGKGYERNNAAAKSGLTKAILDNGLGQLLSFVETKSKVTGGEFVKVPPHYTSQECSNCGEIVKKALSNRTHICPSCGYIADRDVNAAINILNRGVNLFQKSYPCCSVESHGREDCTAVVEPSNNLGSSDTCSLLSLEPLPGKTSTTKPTTKKRRKSKQITEPRIMPPEPLQQLTLHLWGSTGSQGT